MSIAVVIATHRARFLQQIQFIITAFSLLRQTTEHSGSVDESRLNQEQKTAHRQANNTLIIITTITRLKIILHSKSYYIQRYKNEPLQNTLSHLIIKIDDIPVQYSNIYDFHRIYTCNNLSFNLQRCRSYISIVVQ